MCFYLDPQLSPKLAFVQFPKKFHNMTEHDIYDGQINYYWRRWLGLDRLGGPSISGCNLYLKGKALYGTNNSKNDVDLNHLRKSFGSSNELIKSIYKDSKTYLPNDGKITSAIEKDAQLLASCTYDSHSEWGKEVGFIYFSVVGEANTRENFTLSREDFCVD
ncbi:Cellulose synthase (UDP-forming) [Handroanthus impetiginosus]|uniref:Cellulose synthase (UDP-forming) n=1 Tax=Handroanthus impetiginosus TaxID=429701 RepID=A0A2G9HAJ4_9LAMI|nr:Cellulose synthase (UDP-forming) [Handroanthus impetiginosus]